MTNDQPSNKRLLYGSFGPLHPMGNTFTEKDTGAVYPMENNSDGEAVNNMTG